MTRCVSIKLQVIKIVKGMLILLSVPTLLAYAEDKKMKEMKEVILGGGCFWCVEAVYQGFQGIEHVESGYSGGKVPNPTYERVSVGTTGHAEVVKITYDPTVISFKDILTIFFHSHDPTTLNRQGADVGTQYRSVIFYANDQERKIAEDVKGEVERGKLWRDPIVTEIAKLERYYKAEDYHQDYFDRNKEQPYCSIVIAPKLAKIYKEFCAKLKPEIKAKCS
jgi:methionine-S-sulfoxide reductase